MSFFELVRDKGALGPVLASMVRYKSSAFLDLLAASSLVQKFALSNAEEICLLAWNISGTDPLCISLTEALDRTKNFQTNQNSIFHFTAKDAKVNWYKELIEIAKHFKNAEEADSEVYFLGDESKTEEELLATKLDVRSTRLAHDRRGTLELTYARPILLRAKPLTSLDLCFSGEHEEAAVVTLSKRLSFFPTNGAGIMYYEATTTSLAKRNGGATIGFSLESPYAMPGAGWYTFSYSIDSGIVRNGIGIPPVKNITNGHKKPKVGDVWGVGYQVHLKDGTLSIPLYDKKGAYFLDDNFERRDLDYPHRTSFFVTCNGVLKFLIYVNSTPLLMQPVLMLANSKDSLILNMSGDEAHPFRFNIAELAALPRPPAFQNRRGYEFVIGPGAPAVFPPTYLPPLASPSYIPIAKKTIQPSDEELSTYGCDRFATMNGSYRHLSVADDICAKRLPFTISQDVVELDINLYYARICSELSPDEARNIVLHLSPKMTDTEQNQVLEDPSPRQTLLTMANELVTTRSIWILFGYEAYVRNFANLKRLVDRKSMTPTPAPGSAPWTTELFHADYPFPVSMASHRAMRMARVMVDGITHQLQGIYANPYAYWENISNEPIAMALNHATVEFSWAESQMRRLILNIPTTMNPSYIPTGHPKQCLLKVASYRDLFDIISVLRSNRVIDLNSLEINASTASSPSKNVNSGSAKVNIPQFTFPSHDTIATWATGASTIWLELFVWNAFLSIPVVPDLEWDASKPVLPEGLTDAFQAVMAMIAKERKRLNRASLASAAAARIIATTPLANLSTAASLHKTHVPSPSASPSVSINANSVIISPTSLIAVRPLDRANEGFLELHIEALSSIIRQCDHSTTISTAGLIALRQGTQTHLIHPLPLPTDLPVPATLEIRRHGYFFACDQIHQLHFLIGPHPLLVPLIEWRLTAGLARVADLDKELAMRRHLRHQQIERQTRASKDYKPVPADQQHEYVYPVSPRFTKTAGSASSAPAISSIGPHIRPAAAAAMGVVLASIIGLVGYYGYKTVQIFKGRAPSHK